VPSAGSLLAPLALCLIGRAIPVKHVSHHVGGHGWGNSLDLFLAVLDTSGTLLLLHLRGRCHTEAPSKAGHVGKAGVKKCTHL